MKLIIGVVAAAMFVPSMSAAQPSERCGASDLIVSISETRGRNAWSRKCGYVSVSTENYLNMELLYVTYANGCQSGCSIYVPVVETAPCIAGLVKLAYCYGDCYTPQQRLLFQGEFVGISRAYESGILTITTLAPNVTMTALAYGERPIRSYLKGQATKEVFMFRMQDTRILQITSKHPMVMKSGKILAAEELKVGDELLGADGRGVMIQEVANSLVTDVFWNIQPESTQKAENILNVEGVLTGSARFQNDWANEEYRLLMRDEISLDYK